MHWDTGKEEVLVTKQAQWSRHLELWLTATNCLISPPSGNLEVGGREKKCEVSNNDKTRTV